MGKSNKMERTTLEYYLEQHLIRIEPTLHPNTHKDYSGSATGLLLRVAGECGVSPDRILTAEKAVTAHHFLSLIGEDEIPVVCRRIASLAVEVCRNRYSLDVGCVVTNYQGEILGRANA